LLRVKRKRAGAGLWLFPPGRGPARRAAGADPLPLIEP